jgi:DNA transformation protein
VAKINLHSTPMPRKSEFVEYLLEMLQPLGAVRAKSMFGGWGLYADERFFAIIADETLYFKVDDINCEEFEARGLKPFRYEMNEKVGTMRYYPPPPEALDDRELLCVWARKGVEAAERAKVKQKPRKKKNTAARRG